MGINGISRSQVSELAKSLDGMVEEFRNRPLDTEHYTYLWVDALYHRVREGGRVVNVATRQEVRRHFRPIAMRPLEVYVSGHSRSRLLYLEEGRTPLLTSTVVAGATRQRAWRLNRTSACRSFRAKPGGIAHLPRHLFAIAS